MGRTDKPLLAVSIASKVLLQHRHDSAIPMLLTILTIVSIIQFVFLLPTTNSLLRQQSPVSRNYSYLKLQQVAATIPLFPNELTFLKKSLISKMTSHYCTTTLLVTTFQMVGNQSEETANIRILSADIQQLLNLPFLVLEFFLLLKFSPCVFFSGQQWPTSIYF